VRPGGIKGRVFGGKGIRGGCGVREGLKTEGVHVAWNRRMLRGKGEVWGWTVVMG